MNLCFWDCRGSAPNGNGRGGWGPLAHIALWTALWNRRQLLGDSVTMQWVPSHVGVQGNERADEDAVKGSGGVSSSAS